MMFDCPLSGELFIHVDLHVDGSDENDESLLTMMMVITVEDSDGHDDDNDGGDDDGDDYDGDDGDNGRYCARPTMTKWLLHCCLTGHMDKSHLDL